MASGLFAMIIWVFEIAVRCTAGPAGQAIFDQLVAVRVRWSICWRSNADHDLICMSHAHGGVPALDTENDAKTDRLGGGLL